MKNFIEDLLNIWIVYHEGREACLIESVSYQDKFEENWKIIKLNLYIQEDTI